MTSHHLHPASPTWIHLIAEQGTQHHVIRPHPSFQPHPCHFLSLPHSITLNYTQVLKHNLLLHISGTFQMLSPPPHSHLYLKFFPSSTANSPEPPVTLSFHLLLYFYSMLYTALLHCSITKLSSVNVSVTSERTGPDGILCSRAAQCLAHSWYSENFQWMTELAIQKGPQRWHL